MKYELLMSYLLPVIGTALVSLAGFFGAQLKALYQKYVNDRTKEAVARTCVKAVEQLYHDLGGPEKLKKAQEGIRQMLEEKGIPISELEMEMLIESVVSEFNYGFNTAVRSLGDARDDGAEGTAGGDPSATPQNDKKTEEAGGDPSAAPQDDSAEYSEEGGGV